MALLSCNSASHGTVASVDGGDSVVEVVPPARRPLKRYYLGRTKDRCEVYTVEGDLTSTLAQTPCPPDLENGERIRLAGKTCVREGEPGSPRELPVVCPDPLKFAELKDRGVLK
jgi:hypothetical protein